MGLNIDWKFQHGWTTSFPITMSTISNQTWPVLIPVRFPLQKICRQTSIQ
jgi:hypothetical protein